MLQAIAALDRQLVYILNDQRIGKNTKHNLSYKSNYYISSWYQFEVDLTNKMSRNNERNSFRNERNRDNDSRGSRNRDYESRRDYYERRGQRSPENNWQETRYSRNGTPINHNNANRDNNNETIFHPGQGFQNSNTNGGLYNMNGLVDHNNFHQLYDFGRSANNLMSSFTPAQHNLQQTYV